MSTFLVFDVGGSAIKYGLLDEQGRIQHKDSIPTPTATFSVFRDAISDIYQQHQSSIAGVAFSLPGVIDSVRGRSITGGSLEFNDNRDFIKDMQPICHHPITIENDGKCAALAEHWLGSLQESTNAAVLVLGSGVGGGLILNHQLYRGSHSSAGEFSFVLLNSKIYKGDKFHYLGLDGSAVQLVRTFEKQRHRTEGSLTGHDLFRAVDAGEADACSLLDAYTYHLAIQMFNIQAMFDLDKIAIGGGISSQPALFHYLQSNVDDLRERLPKIISIPQIVPCQFRNDANLIGALKAHLSL